MFSYNERRIVPPLREGQCRWMTALASAKASILRGELRAETFQKKLWFWR